MTVPDLNNDDIVNEDKGTDEQFSRLLEFVESELAFATSHYNDSYLDRRITSRMRRTRTSTYDEYLEILRDDPDEQDALLDSMSINVTGFFRNPDVWDGIRDVLHDLTASHDRIHIWSAACADGREPYSLSMLAHDDPQIDESAVHIVGTDISKKALRTAKRGVYRGTKTVDLGDQLEYLSDWEQYVDRDGEQYRVRETVRENVHFQRHDLINDGPKSGFDIVVCRNLFIYIDNEYKEPMLETIARSLRTDGYLVIGKAETIPPMLKSAFSVLDGRLRIYRRDPLADR